MSPEDFRSSYVSAILESCVVVLLPFFVLCPYVGAECSPPSPITLLVRRMLKRDVAGNPFANFTLIFVYEDVPDYCSFRSLWYNYLGRE